MKELHKALVNDLRNLVATLSGYSTDKALPIMKRKSWELGDKYNMSGDEVVKFLFDNYQEIVGEKRVLREVQNESMK